MKMVFPDVKTLGFKMDLEKLKRIGELNAFDHLSDEAFKSVVVDADIVITNQYRLNAENLQKARKLKLICQAGTGYDNIDIEYCKKRGIAVANVPNYAAVSVAQHTFSMLFYLLSHSRYYDTYVKQGMYSANEPCHSGNDFFEIEGKTWGIIGMGEIGKRVAKYARGFNCNVVYYSTSGSNNDNTFKRVSLEELLKVSDFVSIHAPLNDYTQNLIQLKEMKLMKKSAILLNLGRGGIINEEDLSIALNEHIILAAGLDVLQNEPMSLNNPLYSVKDCDRIFITPHIAYGSIEARERLVTTICENIKSFIKGSLINGVNS